MHLEALLQAHVRRLRELELQSAAFGLNAPPQIRIEIQDIQAAIDTIAARLGVARHVLPAPVVDFVGRDEEIARLVTVLSAAAAGRSAMACVRGMGGMGKTQLDLAAAQRLVSSFPDGQVLVVLRGTSESPVPPALVLQAVIRTFNRESTLPDDPVQLQEIYNSLLNGRRVLIVADDARPEQIQLLAPPPGCGLLITTRQRFVLPGMIALDLDILPNDAAEQLLLAICPRINGHASELARLCGYLPLALRVSASLLESSDSRSVTRYLTQLEVARLTHLRDLDALDDPAASFEASLRLSYDSLGVDAQAVLSQTGIFPARFALAAAR